MTHYTAQTGGAQAIPNAPLGITSGLEDHVKGTAAFQKYATAENQGSSVGPQLTLYHVIRKALIDNAKDQLFTQMADSIKMPKNSGRTIKRFLYRPVLSDFNVNDQGLDSAGAVITKTNAAVGDANTAYEAMHGKIHRVAGETDTQYKTRVATFLAKAAEITPKTHSGNIYGRCRASGIITANLPKLTENGGRVGRVGITRVTLESTLENYGFFTEYTQDSIDFDTDAQLEMHMTRLLVEAANEIYEATLQADLIAQAGVRIYAGGATNLATMTGASGKGEVTYMDLVRTNVVLDQNRCPKDTQMITGSTANDTRVVGAARYAYIDSQLQLTLEQMKDPFDNKAFVPVEQYARAGNIAHGEVGAVGNTRFIIHPEMQHDASVAGGATANADYMASGAKNDAYNILYVGSQAFNTISFKSGRNTAGSKLEIIHKRPGAETADRNDPYGKLGFMSIQWWYGTLVNRPEWLACVKTLARV